MDQIHGKFLPKMQTKIKMADLGANYHQNKLKKIPHTWITLEHRNMHKYSAYKSYKPP